MSRRELFQLVTESSQRAKFYEIRNSNKAVRKRDGGFANRIRELREAKHWSQEEFDDLCGIHRTAVGFLERAERNPRLDTLLTISKGLGITVSELLLGLEKRSQLALKRSPLRKRS